ncbi:baseplate J/gp47 family protein [Jannaschia sp. R86511]|uniref:baseplate J/gp47 family protein n=1 Tax=Jannaschia sp. R86511 TaxID=3093853 RepID=UPI0036D3ED85
MSFAAEPFGLFAADLLANLTGGVSRVRFRYLEEERPYRLGEHERVQAGTLRVNGIAAGEFTLFVEGVDLDLGPDGTLVWREASPGVAAAGATVPDLGTDFWVGFDRAPGGPPPVLTDRTPGSVTRTLAESFARELAVLSLQLDAVYDGAFVDTATGRDLDGLAALVGVDRRGATQAAGQVVVSRTTPAPADITVLAGTLVSTDAQAPVAATVETTETVTLRRGTVSVQAPVRALTAGPSGVAAARTLTVLHRPIFGVDDVINPEPMAFRGGAETDVALRARIQRSLDVAGRSTVGAIVGALTAVEGIGEADVHVEENHLAFPGVVRVTVAAPIDAATAALAHAALGEARPAGVRIDHNLVVPTAPDPTLPQDSGGGGDGPGAGVRLDGVLLPLEALLTVTPADTALREDQRRDLEARTGEALTAAVRAVAVGEPVVYNRLVATVMAVEGVLDAVLEIGAADRDAAEPLRRFNIRPPAACKPTLDAADLTVVLRGERIVLDLTVVLERRGLAASEPAGTALAAARADIERRLVEALQVTPPEVSTSVLTGLLDPTDDYAVESISYRVELLDEGVRVSATDVTVPVGPAQQIWIRSVVVTEETVS